MEYLTLLDPKLEGNNTIKYIIELLSPLIKLDQNNRFDKSKVSNVKFTEVDNCSVVVQEEHIPIIRKCTLNNLDNLDEKG